jgi:hypothetical protein
MPQVTTFGVSYEDAECSGSGQLLLEDEGTIRLGRQAINFVRVFPAVPVKMRVRGNASIAYYDKQAISRHDLIQLSGTRASLRTPRKWIDPCHPASGLPASPWTGYSTAGLGAGAGVSLQVLEAWDAETGGADIPDIHFDDDTNEIVSDQDVYAICEAKYLAGCNRYRVVRSGDAVNSDVAVVAFYRGRFAETTIGAASNLDRVPVYYVTSDYVADENGQWEVPDDWDEENTYADAPAAEPLPDNGSYQQLRRIHEACYLTYRGQTIIELLLGQSENPLQPFESGLGDYDRDFTFRQHPAPDPDRQPDFYKHWQYLDFDELFASAANRFEGLHVPA